MEDIRVIIIGVPHPFGAIREEMELDCGRVPSDVSEWEQQGVLIIDPDHEMAAEITAELNRDLTDCVFLLWGEKAGKMAVLISRTRHCVILGYGPGDGVRWFGTRPFSKANEYLEQHGRGTIDW